MTGIENIWHTDCNCQPHLRLVVKGGEGDINLTETDKKRRILIMDDEEMIGEIACQMLEHLGYEGQHVKDGEAAVEEYTRCFQANEPYDVVIMDLTIPGGMGGKEAVTRVLEVDPQAKVLVSSGYSTDPIMTQYGDYGFTGVINKPFDLASIKGTLDAILHD